MKQRVRISNLKSKLRSKYYIITIYTKSSITKPIKAGYTVHNYHFLNVLSKYHSFIIIYLLSG